MDKVLQFVMPPRVLLLGGSILLLLLSLVQADSRLVSVSLLVLLLTGSALVLATPNRYYNRRTLAALATLPHGFWLMFSALFKLRNVNKKFIHTEHSVTGKWPLQGK
jgi:hypothetical protein